MLEKKQGSVAYISSDYCVIKYNGEGVVVKKDLMVQNKLSLHDLVEFNARPLTRSEQILYEANSNKYMALKVRILKSPKVCKGQGIFEFIDPTGEFGYIKFQDTGGDKFTVYATRGTIQPPVNNMHSRFKIGEDVRVVCCEQNEHKNVKWRSVAITDFMHSIEEDPKRIATNGKTGVYRVVPCVTMPKLEKRQGSVAYICSEYCVLKYNGEGVVVKNDKMVYTKLAMHDLVEFDARPLTKAEQMMFDSTTNKYIALRIKLIKSPRVCKGQGLFEFIDPSGEFGYIKFEDNRGDKFTVYATRGTVQPASSNLHSQFKVGDFVRVVCCEQNEHKNVKWRTVIITDFQHTIEADPTKIAVAGKAGAFRVVSKSTDTTHTDTSDGWQTSGSVRSHTAGAHSSASYDSQNGDSEGIDVDPLPSQLFIDFDEELKSLTTTDPWQYELEKLRMMAHKLSNCEHCKADTNKTSQET